MMQRISMIAAREFIATVSSKGFLVALLLVPAIGLVSVVAPRMFNSRNPNIVGQVAVADASGSVGSELRAALAPEAIVARRARAMQSVPALIPNISVIDRSSAEPLQTGKQWLTQPASGSERHLALVVVRPNAVVRHAADSEYGSYDLYVSSRLDDGTEAIIVDGMQQALRSARLKAASIDPAAVQTAMNVIKPTSVTVGPNGERPTQRVFARVLPVVCGALILFGVIMGGQMLMVSTVEEKSNRVVEVLLAAVSPLELMWGKLLGQLGVGFLMLAVYLGLGILALVLYALIGMIDPLLIVYLVVFYFLAYLVYSALMLAIGAAVSRTADAQSLTGPLILSMIFPNALVPMIVQAPNSTLSVVLSFIPPLNSFAMLARLTSEAPPPMWQVFGAVLAGLAGVCVAVWFAAKVFKIALLMHGKPPDLATMVRWARMA